MILAVNQDIKIAGGPWWDSRVVRSLLHTRQGDTPRFTDHTAAEAGARRRQPGGGGSRAAFHPDDLRGLTPLLWSHVNPYGECHLDLDDRAPARR